MNQGPPLSDVKVVKRRVVSGKLVAKLQGGGYLGLVAMIHHDACKGLEKEVIRRMEGIHHLVGEPLIQYIDIFIVHSPKEEFHYTALVHGTVTDVFRAETQFITNVGVGKVEAVGDLGAAYLDPFGTMLNISLGRVRFSPKDTESGYKCGCRANGCCNRVPYAPMYHRLPLNIIPLLSGGERRKYGDEEDIGQGS